MNLKRKTKIVATIGPASENMSTLTQLIKEGVNVVRLNFSHGNHKEHGERIKNIRQIEKNLGKPVAIIADLQGPKIRVGKLPDNGLVLKSESKIIINTQLESILDNEIPLPSSIFEEGTSVGHTVFFDDGKIQVEILGKNKNKFLAKVTKGGILFSNKGVNVPMLANDSAILVDKDKKDLAFAVKSGADYLAISFVRNANDIMIVRKALKNSPIKIIVKIERPEALKNLDEIIEVSDAVMIARGDLRIETALWELPVRQKEITERVRQHLKPVIVATQMLDSMMKNPIPTRAEISDVANAVFDSADAVMLSGETASGDYPVETVRIMRQTLESAEKFQETIEESGNEINSILNSVAHSAKHIALEIGAKAIIAGTITGKSARAVSHFRPKTPIISLTSDDRSARELSLAWGVNPIIVKNAKTIDELSKNAIQILKKDKFLSKGDKVVFISGNKLGAIGKTNSVSVIAVE